MLHGCTLFKVGVQCWSVYVLFWTIVFAFAAPLTALWQLRCLTGFVSANPVSCRRRRHCRRTDHKIDHSDCISVPSYLFAKCLADGYDGKRVISYAVWEKGVAKCQLFLFSFFLHLQLANERTTEALPILETMTRLSPIIIIIVILIIMLYTRLC